MRKLLLESLEQRQLMAGDVAGTIYEDLNRNGARDNGENGIAAWTVYLDLNRDGVLSTGEPSAVTNKDGDYLMKNVTKGAYRVAMQVASGWIPTSPASQDINVDNGKTTSVNFFAFGGGSITGTVWNDTNQDGTRQTDPATGNFIEPSLEGWTVFLDLNTNRAFDSGEPSTLTDSNGVYRFDDLPSGDYEVSEVLPAGWEPTKGYDSKQTATVTALHETTQDFANFSTTNGSIKGTIYNDLNADGVRDVDATTGAFSEPGLEGWSVFLDQNNNGLADSGEPFDVTNADGQYHFLGLAAGDYEVTEAIPVGWNVSPMHDSRQTVAVRGGENSTAEDFANFTILNGSIRGFVWNDLNQNGNRDVDPLTGAILDPALAGWKVYLDLNRNRLNDTGEPNATTDLEGQYLFPDLQVGDYEVVEVVPVGWEPSTTFSDQNTVTVYSGTESLAPDFANFDSSTASPGTLAGTVWNDLNANGIYDATEPGVAGRTVYLDSNQDGLLTSGEPTFTTLLDGSYRFLSVPSGTVTIGLQSQLGWKATVGSSNVITVSLRSGQDLAGLDFGQAEVRDAGVHGTLFNDRNKNGLQEPGEEGLSGLTVYIDLNSNKQFDADEPSTLSSKDLFYTPGTNEAGEYSFSHLAPGDYTIRTIVSSLLSATPPSELEHTVTIVNGSNIDIDDALQYRPTELHGVKFEDLNGNHVRDTGESGLQGVRIYVDLNRNNAYDAIEPMTTTAFDGTYSFSGLSTGAYVVREIVDTGFEQTAPTTVSGDLWPIGVSNAPVGNVTPLNITASLAEGQSLHQAVSITLPNSGSLTNAVDVFLLFDDTGSFVNNSPIVRAAFPDIISQLNASLPGIDLGFGVGRMEEYADFAWEYSTGRPFILNQPIVAASTTGYMSAIQAALDRETPGYGGDQPETDIEALYQLVTGKGFDGNQNGSTLDSGFSGLASTQLNPGASGDVPAFSSFVPDPINSVFPAAGNVGGAGFRSGALPIVLLATDTGFAYQPKGETSIIGVGGLSLPLSMLTETSRNTTPFDSGAGIQETVTALNALGALVIGLGTEASANIDPRQQLESLSKLTGATNQTTTTIDNGTLDPIAPGDPLYFQIASGFGASVANGVVSAIQNAVTNVAVDIDVVASDPRVHIVNHTGVAKSIGSGMTANFDIEFVGDGVPRRFDLQFVRAGTNVVLGSIPVVLGTPISGDGYEFDELEDGEISDGVDFGNHRISTLPSNAAPTFVKGADVLTNEDSGLQTIANWATSISPGPDSESWQTVNFIVSSDNSGLFATVPTISPNGTLTFETLPNAFGQAIVTVQIHDNGGTLNGGVDTSLPQQFAITVSPVNDAPNAVGDAYSLNEDETLTIAAPGLLINDMDVDSPTLTTILKSSPTHGSVTFNADGSFSYRPDANYNGQDAFTYVANDGSLDSNVVTVSVDVLPVNDAPVAKGEAFTVNEGALLSIAAPGVLLNDFDVDSANIVAILNTAPNHGTLVLNPDGSFTYQPAVGFTGADSFTYVASDGSLDSNVVTVSILVQPITGTSHFWVVDGNAKKDFDYDANGNLVRSIPLSKENTKAKGLAFSKDGSRSWTVDSKGVVFVYDSAGKLLGSWEAKGIDKPEGITVDDRNVWIVDKEKKQIYRFNDAVTVLRGTRSASSIVRLTNANSNPTDIVSDGLHLWVTNDGNGTDKIYRYSPTGNLEGSWTIDPRNGAPRGIALDPAHPNSLFVVDGSNKTVFEYPDSVGRIDGSQAATVAFVLHSADSNPEGIAVTVPANRMALRSSVAMPVSVVTDLKPSLVKNVVESARKDSSVSQNTRRDLASDSTGREVESHHVESHHVESHHDESHHDESHHDELHSRDRAMGSMETSRHGLGLELETDWLSDSLAREVARVSRKRRR